MPSNYLKNLFEKTKETLAEDHPLEYKIFTINMVIDQSESEIKDCESILSRAQNNLIIIPPNDTNNRIRLELEIKRAEAKKLTITALLNEAKTLLLDQKSLVYKINKSTASNNESSNNDGVNQVKAVSLESNKTKIFISHSEKDKEVASALVDYLLSSLRFNDDKDIRASSVDGHGFKYGYLGNNMKNDLDEAPILIALITEESLKSYWVMMELGAAWILSKKMIPILAPSIRHNDLHEIIKANHYIEISNSNASAKLSEMIDELSSDLRIEQKNGGKRQVNLENFLRLFKQYKSRKSENAGIQLESTNTANAGRIGNDHKDIEELIIKAIINLDNDEYYTHGYKIEKISEKTNLNISKCKLALASLIKNEYIKKNNIIGGSHGGEYYGLTENGLIFIKEHILSV